ncbi:MAG: cytochrome P450 [Nannocystaceae bacterium]
MSATDDTDDTQGEAGPIAPVARIGWRGLLPVFLHPYRAYRRLHARHGPTFMVDRPGRRSLVFTADEALAWRVLVDHAAAIQRPPNVIRSVFQVIVGENIVASAGTEWTGKRQRGTHRLREATVEEDQQGALGECVRELRRDLAAAITESRTVGEVDLLPAVERYSLAAAIRLIARQEVDPDGREFAELLAAMREIMHATQRIADLRKQMFLYALVPAARRRMDRRRMRSVEGAVRRIAAFEPDPEVRELFMAGYENPSTTLTWALALLAGEPGWQARVRAEARSIPRLGDAPVPLADFARLEVADAVVRETARLRPAIAYLARQAREDVVVDGLHLARGTHVIVVPWCLHMDPRRWPDPDRFDPGRFLAGAAPARLWSFGVGPRACVGTRYALQVLVAALAAIADDAVWSLAPGFEPPAPSGRFPWSEKIRCRLALREAPRP